jgi:hypothetical protein
LFYGSSWRLSCSSTEHSVNLLASDDDSKKIEEKSEDKRLLTIPIKINIEKNLPPGIVEDAPPPNPPMTKTSQSTYSKKNYKNVRQRERGKRRSSR